MPRVAICGAAGRMGRVLVALCREGNHVMLGAAIESAKSPFLGRDAGELAGAAALGIRVTTLSADVMDRFDVLVDFTVADGTPALLGACRAAGKRMVIGTTGHDAKQRAEIAAASKDVAIVHAPNMSVGVNVCFKLAETAARIVGRDSAIEIIETHHSGKQDAPSGTAVHLGELVAAAIGLDAAQVAVDARRQMKHGTIDFRSIREGEVVGDHTVAFSREGERIEITHHAASRRNFAAGALRAARWIMDRQNGLYDMQDVLGLR